MAKVGICHPCPGPLCTENPVPLVGGERLCVGCTERRMHDAAVAVVQAMQNGQAHVRASLANAMALRARAYEMLAEAEREIRKALNGLRA